jgi:PAS domain S-box-containing protein
MIYELILNSTLLVTLAVLFSFVSRSQQSSLVLQQIISGILFGGITIIGMNIPMTVSAGIFYDGRSTVLALSGLFGGCLSGLISMAMALAYRIYLGGAGIWAGSASILAAATFGLLFRRFYHQRPEKITALSLYLLGIVVNLAMLACQLLLPSGTAINVISQVWQPILLIFPVATLMMGLILRNEIKRINAEIELHKRETNYSSTLHSIKIGIITTNKKGMITYINPTALKLTAFRENEALEKPVNDVFKLINESTGQQTDFPYQTILQQGKSIHLPNIHLLVSVKGVHIPVLVSASPVKDDFGSVTGLVLTFKDQTRERHLRQKLFESERLYYSLTEKSPVGIFRTKPNGHATYVNPQWSKISGLSFNDALGDGWLKAVHPEDRKSLIKEGTKATGFQNLSKTEYRFIRENGDEKWVLGVAVPEFDENKQLTGYIGTIIDIDDRKNAEKELIQSHRNFRRTMDEFPLGMRIVSNNGETKYVNDAFLNLYGYASDEEYRETPSHLRYTEKSLQEHEARKTRRKHGLDTATDYEIEIINQQGQTRNVLVKRKAIFWDNKPESLAIYQDITERRKAEHSLQLLGRAIEQSPVSTIITNNKGETTYINPKFTEVSGYKPEEIIGLKPSILKSGHHPAEFYTAMWKTISSGKEWRGELLNKRKNGELFWENVQISSLLNQKGKITHYIGVKEDITEKKTIVSDLQKAKEKAEESDRLKSAFLANMSHEIRTPLNVILGFTNLLVEEELDKDIRKQFSTILTQSSDNLLQVINDILDISKIETGQLTFHNIDFNIQPVILDLFAVSKQLLKKYNRTDLRLNYFVPPNPVSVRTDKVRFNQIFTNLISNAVKFTQEGEINFGAKKVENGFVLFFVEDTGIGISKDRQQDIFERFRQVEDSSTRTYGGTGLGLSISKKLVEQMGGTISLESEPGKGSTFTFRIPVS